MSRELPNFRTNSWVYCSNWDLIVGVAPKCGKTAIHEIMKKNTSGVWHPNGEDAYKVWIVREPVSRFKSLWRDKCRNKTQLWGDEEDAPLADMSPEDLMDFIETTNLTDPHWTTQWSQCGAVPDKVLPLEHLAKWWDERGLPKMKKMNRTRGEVNLSPKLLLRIRTYYSDDVILYHGGL